MGVSVYHVGFQFSGMRQQQELNLTEATYRARWNAMARMQAEADALKADGSSVSWLNWRHHGEGGGTPAHGGRYRSAIHRRAWSPPTPTAKHSPVIYPARTW